MAAKSTYAAEIAVSPEQIPEVKEPMPVLMLGAKIVAPDALLRDIIGAVSPNAVIREFGHAGARAAHDGQRLVAFINPKTGESSVFPALEALKPGPELADRARRVAAHLAQDTSIFPEDGTEIAALAPVTLMGARRSRDGKRTSPAEYLAFARYERRVDGLPVFGPGTRRRRRKSSTSAWPWRRRGCAAASRPGARVTRGACAR